MRSENSSATVSVIIPAHNAAQFICESIDSVLEQTLQPREILVVDDGSTDQTVQLVENFSHPVRLIKQKHQGVSAARNLGICESLGGFVAFIDADDVFIEPTKLQKQLQIIIDKNCDIVMSGWRITDENLNIIADRPVWLEVPHLNLFNWLRSVAVLPSAMMVRRSKLVDIGGFDEDLTNAEDVDLIFRLALAGCRAEWLQEITVAYRKHSTNASHHVHRQNEGMQKVIEKLFQRDDLPVSIRQVESEIRYHSLVWSAYDCFLAGDLPHMKNYLLNSQRFARFSRVGLLTDWFYSFERFSTAHGKPGPDLRKLLYSTEWQELETILSSDYV
jgi:glycosyltransferase involved in cell wall biosynthesis